MYEPQFRISPLWLLSYCIARLMRNFLGEKEKEDYGERMTLESMERRGNGTTIGLTLLRFVNQHHAAAHWRTFRVLVATNTIAEQHTNKQTNKQTARQSGWQQTNWRWPGQWKQTARQLGAYRISICLTRYRYKNTPTGKAKQSKAKQLDRSINQSKPIEQEPKKASIFKSSI